MEKQIKEISKDLCNAQICETEIYDECKKRNGSCALCQTVAEKMHNLGYRKENTKYMLKADGSLEMIPTVESVRAKAEKELIERIKRGEYEVINEQANVISISEVEGYIAIMFEAELIKAKQDVAREISEEICKELDKEIERYEKLSRNTIEPTATRIYGTSKATYIDVKHFIAELKKKYIGE